MADFIAVIRRAVDGLSDNNPETRAKVYARARDAVRRQLENMKPRPPEATLQRQFDKLEAAIVEVESEHSEALPMPSEPAAAQAPYASAPESYQTSVDEVVPVPASSYEGASAVDDQQQTDAFEPQADAIEAAGEYQPSAPVQASVTQSASYDVQPISNEDHMLYSADAAGHGASTGFYGTVSPALPQDDYGTPEVSHPAHGFSTLEHPQEEALPEGNAHFDPVWTEPATEQNYSAETPASGWEREELQHFPNDPAPVAAVRMPSVNENFSWEAAAFDDLPPIQGGQQHGTPVSAHFGSADDVFDEVHGTSFAQAQQGGVQSSVTPQFFEQDASNDLNDLVAAKLQNKNFRMEPKRAWWKNTKALGAAVVIVLLAGGAYAAWVNRQSLQDLVSSLSSKSPATKTATGNNSAPATNNAANPSPVQPNGSQASPNSSKLTQRLLPDGKEVNNGPAEVAQADIGEGKSIAPQTVASTPDASVGGTQTAQASTPVAAVGETEKAILYEERIGQGAARLTGTIAWTTKQETAENGRQLPVIQGTITIPERKLSAVVTFKRNFDTSLPASHLVEVVFSFSPDFEGGGINDVQRISMKQTEQDQGNALSAVPAKITDDFYMLGLNNYAEAQKTNLALLTRDWIDIPVKYNNGRGALFTFQKGETGKAVFDSVLKAWAAEP